MTEGIMFSGKDEIQKFREITLLNGLRLEVKTGMRLTSKAPTCYTIIKREYGLKGNKEKVLDQFEKLLLKECETTT
jgi:hypothetical protein